MAMGQIDEYGLISGRVRLFAEAEGRSEVLLRLPIVPLLVVGCTDFVENKWIRLAYVFRLLEMQQS